MKRKILEITEIDCGDETCDRCHLLAWNILSYCRRFQRADAPRDGKRLPECLEAEKMYFQYVGYEEMAKAYIEMLEQARRVKC